MANSSFQTGEQEFVQGRREQYGPDERKVPPPVVNLAVTESDYPFPDGSIPLEFLVEFQKPRWWGKLAYDVYGRNDTQSDPEFKHLKRITGPDAVVSHPYLGNIGDTYTISVVAVSAGGRGLPPEDGTTDTVTVAGLGPEIEDITGFDVTVECCDLIFTWDANSLPFIDYYEIRQGVDFDTGSTVIVVGPSALSSVVVSAAQLPLALSGTGLDFHIKARTRTRAVNLTEDSDTLTAAELACIEAFCCVKLREVALTPGFDTIVVTSDTPGLPGIPPIINVGPRNTGGGGGRTISGAPVGPSFVPNGLLYDYTIQLDDVALAGEFIVVTEGVRLH